MLFVFLNGGRGLSHYMYLFQISPQPLRALLALPFATLVLFRVIYQPQIHLGRRRGSEYRSESARLGRPEAPDSLLLFAGKERAVQ